MIEIDLIEALRDQEYRREISDSLETSITDTVMFQAADEIEKLREALLSIDAVAVDFGYFEDAARTMKEIATKALAL